jgi:sulfur-carrier protein adenylyltransferase/sulfurtransferase
MVKEVTVQELKAMMDEGDDFQLIDCREPHEVEICTIGGELMPVGTITDFEEEISKGKKVIIHCRSGSRSTNACLLLQDMYGYENLYNLKGGILAYAREIDTTLTQY